MRPKQMIGVFVLASIIFLLVYTQKRNQGSAGSTSETNQRAFMKLHDDPHDVVWIVQFSDLHFSVHHPDRALDFKNLVPPTLDLIKPSLVLITGDLTDGKSKDLLTMKQDKEEWMEYDQVMEHVVEKSGLDKSIFYDLRGNHDNFGVPAVGGPLDYFSNYSLNGKQGRNGLVNSVTIQTGKRRLLFVGFDSTMSLGLRGPTNLFGHPTDKLLSDISFELSQWDSQSSLPVTKISFGHFPISFSASSYSGKTLKNTLLNHSLSAYLCGHLHTRFGKNLKRHHVSNHRLLSQEYMQLNPHEILSEIVKNCSTEAATPTKEFWEWEMGDWRKSRAMRILAIDRGDVSFVDTDIKSEAKTTIILVTYPLDSRFMSTILSARKYICQEVDSTSYGTIRALVFSSSPIVSVVARIFDSSLGYLVIMEEFMQKKENESASSREVLYDVPWNFKAFEDPSPDRYWLQIEAIDIKDQSTVTELRPFSVHGLVAKVSWTWKEFLVMGCQWAALYFPIFWIFYIFMFSVLLIPRSIIIFSKTQWSYKNFIANKNFTTFIVWVSSELYKIPKVWFLVVAYLCYLVLCPWLIGQVLTDGEKGYMTYKGWVLNINSIRNLDFLGYPDIMVIVFPHLFFVVLPAVLVIMALAAERAMYQDFLLSLSGKKKDDYNKRSALSNHDRNNSLKLYLQKRWFRIILFVVSLAICLKHYQNCRALVKAYEMNPLAHFSLYCLSIPLLLAYVVYKTGKA
ncbi:putative metallophosphoesterase At3g03305 isoform X2 [Daucus carota subsp. sativus]|nr:PREDICTED: putative metallophosphoesterase At3g03305 isoform X2 [Daucus carota subsp. sativus]